jgi:tRNA (mo5U34)-methyltransferase
MTPSDPRHLVAARHWYHTIDLGPVTTPGEYDLRSVTHKALLPASLTGMRCLDVGTHDGFWAFEMEKRGAREVIAIDLDDPAKLDWPLPIPTLTGEIAESLRLRREAFEVAHQVLKSSVERRTVSVYDLDPAQVGTFDFAFVGTLLHHLRDPVGALIALRRVVTGTLVASTAFATLDSLLHPRRPQALMVPGPIPFWEVPNIRGIEWQLTKSGWRVVQRGRPYLQPYGEGWEQPKAPRRLAQLPRHLLLRFGAPHVSFLVVPVER